MIANILQINKVDVWDFNEKEVSSLDFVMLRFSCSSLMIALGVKLGEAT